MSPKLPTQDVKHFLPIIAKSFFKYIKMRSGWQEAVILLPKVAWEGAQLTDWLAIFTHSVILAGLPINLTPDQKSNSWIY